MEDSFGTEITTSIPFLPCGNSWSLLVVKNALFSSITNNTGYSPTDRSSRRSAVSLNKQAGDWVSSDSVGLESSDSDLTSLCLFLIHLMFIESNSIRSSWLCRASGYLIWEHNRVSYYLKKNKINYVCLYCSFVSKREVEGLDTKNSLRLKENS